jgi:hypothetical protein
MGLRINRVNCSVVVRAPYHALSSCWELLEISSLGTALCTLHRY